VARPGLGDYVKYWTAAGPGDAWEVAALDPNRFLGLRGLTDLRGHNLDPKQPRPSGYMEGLWGFLLNEVPGGGTRLVISGYQAIRPQLVGRFVFYWLYSRLPGSCRHVCWPYSSATSNELPPGRLHLQGSLASIAEQVRSQTTRR
jgi:hypothetical protein